MSQNEVPLLKPQFYPKFKGTLVSKRAPHFEAYPYDKVPMIYTGVYAAWYMMWHAYTYFSSIFEYIYIYTHIYHALYFRCMYIYLLINKNIYIYYRLLSLPRKFVEASADPSGRLMRVLFSEFLECSENWLASQLVLNETSSQNDVTGGKFSWMTKAETHRVKFQFWGF